MIFTRNEQVLIALGYERVVQGERGDYVEISIDDIIIEALHVPDNQKWRIYNPEWKDKVFYEWWETEDGTKLYFQKKKVGYADYKIGYWYVSSELVDIEEKPGLHA